MISGCHRARLGSSLKVILLALDDRDQVDVWPIALHCPVTLFRRKIVEMGVPIPTSCERLARPGRTTQGPRRVPLVR